MTPFPEPSPTPETSEASDFLLRWRGKQEGPFALEEIERRIAANEIGLLHEICFEGNWMPIRKFLELCEVREETERLQREEVERRVREQEERERRERETRQRDELLAEEKRKNDLLEAAVRADQTASSTTQSLKSGSGSKGVGMALLVAGVVIGLFLSILFGAIIAVIGLALIKYG